MTEKIKIISEAQLEKFANENGTYVNCYPASYPCILIFIEEETDQNSIFHFNYVYQSDFN